MWNISWYFTLLKESSSCHFFCSSLNLLSFNYLSNVKKLNLAMMLKLVNYCVKLSARIIA